MTSTNELIEELIKETKANIIKNIDALAVEVILTKSRMKADGHYYKCSHYDLLDSLKAKK